LDINSAVGVSCISAYSAISYSGRRGRKTNPATVRGSSICADGAVSNGGGGAFAVYSTTISRAISSECAIGDSGGGVFDIDSTTDATSRIATYVAVGDSWKGVFHIQAPAITVLCISELCISPGDGESIYSRIGGNQKARRLILSIHSGDICLPVPLISFYLGAIESSIEEHRFQFSPKFHHLCWKRLSLQK